MVGLEGPGKMSSAKTRIMRKRIFAHMCFLPSLLFSGVLQKRNKGGGF